MDFKTSCRDCVFASFGPGPEGRERQNGCLAGRTALYETQGVVSGADDGTRQWDVIEGRLCNLCRRADWADAQSTFLGEQVGRGPADLLPLARKEVVVRYKGVVVADATTTIEAIERSLRSIASQSIRPKAVSVLLVRPTAVQETLAFAAASRWFGGTDDRPPVPFKVSSLLVASGWPDATMEEFLAEPPGGGSGYTYQLTLSAGHEVGDGFVADLDADINDNLLDRSLVGRPDGPPLWCNAAIYFGAPFEQSSKGAP